MKPTLALLASLLIAPLFAVHAVDHVAATIKLDVIYKATAQGPLRLDPNRAGDGAEQMFQRIYDKAV